MMELAPEISEDEFRANFADYKPPLTESAAIVEAARCLFCYDAPCTEACPTHIDVPCFIKKIMTRNYLGSARTILSENVLGESCSRACPVEVLCEGACVMNDKTEPPIQIGKLQRFATEWRKSSGKSVFEVKPSNGKSVGLVGAGPASLSCAASLALMGYETVIYEAEEIPGGLDAWGVAAYKLDTSDVLEEIEMIKSLGVRIETGVRVGENIPVDDLLNRHAALFVGIGLTRTRELDLPGINLEGVHDAISFIKRLKTSPPGEVRAGRNVVVIGGGNTAVDAATAALRLGSESVTVIYRRSVREMTAFRHEYLLALSDGAAYRWLTAPVEFLGDSNLEAVRCVRMRLAEPDNSGRRRPVPIEGSEFELKADMALLALGQHADIDFLALLPGIELKDGYFAAHPDTGQTANPRIFAGGDLVHGAKEVVNAVQAGKLAAAGIDKFLSTKEAD